MPKRITLNDEITWRYAQLTMADVMLKDHATEVSSKYFMIRSKAWRGLRTGTMKIGSFFKDEKQKIGMTACCYCGKKDELSMDHIIPRKKLGSDLSENLLPACHHCNSSKGAKDLIEWMRGQGKFPSIFLLRRYLKLVYFYCQNNILLTIPLTEARTMDLPFSLEQIESTLDYLYFPWQLNLTESIVFDEKHLQS